MLRSFELLLSTKQPSALSMINDDSLLLTRLQVGQVHDALGTLKILKVGKTFSEHKKTQRCEFKEKILKQEKKTQRKRKHVKFR